MIKLKVNNYTLKNNKIKEDLTILNISDIHSKYNYLHSVYEYIKDKKIDYIVMPGDILDRHNLKNEDKFIDELINLSKTNKIIMALGNHDKYDPNKKRNMISDENYKNSNFYKRIIDNKNIIMTTSTFKVLEENNNISISVLNLDNDYYIKREKPNDFKTFIDKIDNKYELNKDIFNILLIHSPNCLIEDNKIINYSKLINSTDLILAGHNHGGLVPTWIQDKLNNHRGLTGPFSSLFPKNSYGFWENDNKTLLISNGLTKANDLSSLKFLNKILIPEVDLIHIEKSDTNSFKLESRNKYKI